MVESELEFLLAVGGATIITPLAARKDKSAVVISASMKLTPKKAADARAIYPGAVVDQTWALDSVSRHELLPFSSYDVAYMSSILESKAKAMKSPVGTASGSVTSHAPGRCS